MTAATLHVRRIGIDTYRENVVYLRRDCPVVRAEGFQALAKVEVLANGATILAVLNVVDDARLVALRTRPVGGSVHAAGGRRRRADQRSSMPNRRRRCGR